MLGKFFVKLLLNYAKKHPYFHIKDYMRRWWVIPPSKWYPFSVRVHEILRSDNDRALHDHPWSYMTIILEGGYWEHTADGKVKWYGPGSVLFRSYTNTHRLEVPPGTVATTLFCMGPYRQEWGFHTPEGKIPWRQYLGEEDAQAADVELQKFYPKDHPRFVKEIH